MKKLKWLIEEEDSEFPRLKMEPEQLKKLDEIKKCVFLWKYSKNQIKKYLERIANMGTDNPDPISQNNSFLGSQFI